MFCNFRCLFVDSCKLLYEGHLLHQSLYLSVLHIIIIFRQVAGTLSCTFCAWRTV